MQPPGVSESFMVVAFSCQRKTNTRRYGQLHGSRPRLFWPFRQRNIFFDPPPPSKCSVITLGKLKKYIIKKKKISMMKLFKEQSLALHGSVKYHDRTAKQIYSNDRRRKKPVHKRHQLPWHVRIVSAIL